MTKTLQTKDSQGWTNDDGTVIAPHALYRYVDETGKGGCWYASLANAEKSWQRLSETRADSDSARTRVGGAAT